EDDDLRAVIPDLLRAECDTGQDFDVPQLAELDPAPVDDARPLAEPGQARHEADVAADLPRGLDEVDAPQPSPGEDDRALHPRRSGPDDEHVAVRVRRALEPLRMPAAPELLAGGRVLRADDLVVVERVRDADVAADALPDLVEPALLDLPRQERVGDRRARGADQVPRAAPDDLDHPVRARQAPD